MRLIRENKSGSFAIIPSPDQSPFERHKQHVGVVLRELGEQVFFHRIQEILDIMGVGRLGIDVHWDKETDRIPGAAVEWSFCKP